MAGSQDQWTHSEWMAASTLLASCFNSVGKTQISPWEKGTVSSALNRQFVLLKGHSVLKMSPPTNAKMSSLQGPSKECPRGT